MTPGQYARRVIKSMNNITPSPGDVRNASAKAFTDKTCVVKTIEALTLRIFLLSLLTMPAAVSFAQTTVIKIAFAESDRHKPYAVAVSANGKRAEVLAWKGQDGLHRYSWSYPAKALTHIAKVSDGFGPQETREATRKKIDDVKAAVARDLGLSDAVQKRRADLTKNWWAAHKNDKRLTSGQMQLGLHAISEDGNVTMRVHRGWDDGTLDQYWLFVQGQKRANLTKMLGMDGEWNVDVSAMDVSPDGKTVFIATAGRLVWGHSDDQFGPPSLRLTGTVKSLRRDGCTLNVTAVTSPDGKTVVLSPPRNKVINFPAAMALPPSLRLGVKISVRGSDSGPGTPLTASSVTQKR